jgi:hypothetical protein
MRCQLLPFDTLSACSTTFRMIPIVAIGMCGLHIMTNIMQGAHIILLGY